MQGLDVTHTDKYKYIYCTINGMQSVFYAFLVFVLNTFDYYHYYYYHYHYESWSRFTFVEIGAYRVYNDTF